MTRNGRVRVGVIGVGNMGERHCRVYSTMSRCQLVGVHDVRAAQGQRVARQYDVPYFSQVDDLLASVDAVSLAVSTPFHFDLGMRCLKQGVHLLVEKPIAETVAQAEALMQAGEASGLVVQVGHIERFNPAYTELRQVLQDMQVLAVGFRRLSPYAASNTDVDVVLDLMIHDLDLAADLVGRPPESFTAAGLRVGSATIDHAQAHLRFGSGPLVDLTASRVTEQKVRCIEVTALDAYVQCDLLSKQISIHRRTFGEYLRPVRPGGIKYRQESIVEQIHVPVIEPLLLELQSFLGCISDGEMTLVCAKSGLDALRLALDIRAAIQKELIEVPAPRVFEPEPSQIPVAVSA